VEFAQLEHVRCHSHGRICV